MSIERSASPEYAYVQTDVTILGVNGRPFSLHAGDVFASDDALVRFHADDGLFGPEPPATALILDDPIFGVVDTLKLS